MQDSQVIEITFLRHGRSRADDEGVLEGQYDSPLTDAGRAQIQERAHQWQSQGIAFHAIIASPLARAKESASIIAASADLQVEVDEDWRELDHGPLAGMNRAQAEVLFPRPAFRNPYEAIAGTGESEWDIHIRAARALQKVIRRGAGSYLVVAHGGILNAALRGIVGATPPVNRQGIWFTFNDAGYARLSYLPGLAMWRLIELSSR